VQAYPAVLAVESGLFYESHAIDDNGGGNGDLDIDPGEQVAMSIMLRSVEDFEIAPFEAILSTTTPGITIHDQHATYPAVPARGTAETDAPGFSLSIDPSACATIVVFDLELRFEDSIRRQSFLARVGTVEPLSLLSDDFESDLGWTSDPGATTQGAWVREDPIGVFDGQGQPTNPEDDTSTAGATCWVTGNGEINGKKDENNNDVDGGAATLLSPPFGVPHMLALELSYDRWYYDNSQGGDLFRAEVSNDGAATWTVVEELINSSGGWGTQTADLFALMAPTDDMRLRFMVQDGGEDSAVEGAVDEVTVDAIWVNCDDYTPAGALAPNPVGDTLAVGLDPGGHTVLTWQAPPVDASHDEATLYRIERATSPAGIFGEVGSAIDTGWVDVDALDAAESYYYRVRSENSGGSAVDP